MPPGQPSYDAYRYLEAHYPRDVTEAVTVTVDGGAGRRPARRASSGGSKRSKESPAAPRSCAPADVAFANFAARRPALSARVAGRRARDPRPRPARPATAARLRQHRRLHRPEAEPDRPRAAGRRRSSPSTTLVLLFLLTGSVLLPLKTLLMNSLTLGATLGILVLAFQEGWLDGPLDYTGPAAIEVTSLVFLFAVIFGLATDYAVLVMARIKERLRPRRRATRRRSRSASAAPAG